MKFSTVFGHLYPLESKYSPQHPICWCTHVHVQYYESFLQLLVILFDVQFTVITFRSPVFHSDRLVDLAFPCLSVQIVCPYVVCWNAFEASYRSRSNLLSRMNGPPSCDGSTQYQVGRECPLFNLSQLPHITKKCPTIIHNNALLTNCLCEMFCH